MTYLNVQYAASRVRRSDYPLYLAHFIRQMYLGGHCPLRVCDVGVGSGDFLRAWKAMGCSTYALDREVPDFADEFTGFRTVCFDADTPDLGTHPKCDLVFCKSVVEHLRDPHPLASLVKAVLAPGGVVVMMTPDIRTYGDMFWDDYTHVRPYDRISLPDFLSSEGFSIVDVREVYQDARLAQYRLHQVISTPIRLFPAPLICDLSDRLNWPWLRWARMRTVFVVAKEVR